MISELRLEVLVSASCAACVQALALARRCQREYPEVIVEVVDVDQNRWDPKPGFAGTPMFYLGDTLVSYGNPTWAQLQAAVAAAAA